MKRILLTATWFSLVALALSWLAFDERLPVHRWLDDSNVGPVVGLLNLPAIVIAVVGSGNVHSPSATWFGVGVAIQWFVIGLIVGSIRSWLRRGKTATTDK